MGKVDLLKRMSVVALYGIEGTRIGWQTSGDSAEAQGVLGKCVPGWRGGEEANGQFRRNLGQHKGSLMVQ